MDRRTFAIGAVTVAIATVMLLSVGAFVGSSSAPPHLFLGSLDSPARGDPAPAATTDPAPSPSSTTLNWTNLSIPDSKSPPPETNGNMVWDSTTGNVLLFGGAYYNVSSSRDIYYNDTWTYLGGVWTNVTPLHSPSPSPREGAAMADDPADHEVVLFGGDSHDDALNDTWVWAGGAWTNISATAGTAPPAGYWGSMAYDASASSVLLFGGLNVTSQDGNDTWSFSGGTWTQLHPTTLPPGRQGQGMTYDTAASEVVMFGGNGRVVYQNDTWTYSGGQWAPIPPGYHPGARVNPGLAYDTGLGDVVLYGGQPASFDYYSTWLFSGGAWTQYNLTWNPPNPQDIAQQMVYDPTDQYVFLFYEQDAYGAVVQNWALTYQSGAPPPIQASLAANPNAISLGESSTLTTTASGGSGPYTYAYSTLPAGCTSENRSAITCTPTAAGNYVVGVNVTDTSSDHASAVAALDVSAGPITLAASLVANPGTIAVNQSTSLTVTTGGVPVSELTYTYTALPPGCVSANSATLTCTPTTSGAFSPAVEVHDAQGHFANASTTLTVTSSTPSPNSPSGTSTSVWIEIAVAIVVIVALILLLGATRRRRKEPPPAPSFSPPPPPTPPPPAT